ncbi:hypothetical protein QT381_02770 [Galbitalea sp. SE-J8]|uniref:hypothetical protein n=1 Tax=Galbitalea sp. SE-J8 TaxID=3054952 RepID=UPI00259C7905|nr:hypothetical protein [Galbitalea sp. SE-J8]MDM4761927.1 hypothetical protein [Galbitalea sp. SE-J8]
MTTYFHYDGTTVELLAGYSLDWYIAKFDSYVEAAANGDRHWFAFPVPGEGQAEFWFRLGGDVTAAFTRDAPDADWAKTAAQGLDS